MKALRHLAKEGNIGSMKLKNRIIMSPMGMGSTFDPIFQNASLNARLVDMYVERAKGGAGLIVLSPGFVQSSVRTHNFGYCVDDECFVPAMQSFTRLIHKHGARVGLQILHGGSRISLSVAGAEPVSASPVKNPLTGEVARQVTVAEIKEIVSAYAVAAVRIREAGFDFLEINAYGGTLLREFLSPRNNHRTDQYGGTIDNRLRILKEIMATTRDLAGRDLPLSVKISGDEFYPGGNTVGDAQYIAQALEEAGVDAINVSPAGLETPLPLFPGFSPKGVFLFLPELIKQKVKVPVIASFVHDLSLAEEALEDGKADFISLGRPLLADPELPLKAFQGSFGDIRPCIRCCQGCYDHVLARVPVTCLMNPSFGREKEYRPTPSPKPGRVMVVGAGPAGMQAATTLAQRGHQVTLYEREPRLGGQLNLTAVTPGKGDFLLAIEYFSRQLSQQGVKVFLNTSVTPELVKKEVPDVVILATGARPFILPVPGHEGKNVTSAFDVLAGKVDVGKRVAVIGGGGVGCETALYLVQKGCLDAEAVSFLVLWQVSSYENVGHLTKRGRDVTILEMLPAVASDIGPTRRDFTLKLLQLLGVKVLTEARVIAISREGVEFVMGSQTNFLEADSVVMATGSRPQDELYQELKGQGVQLHLVGDARAPRKALDAILEADDLARHI